MSHAPVRILCVEDSVEDAVRLRGMLRTALSSTGFEYTHLLSGDKIWETIKKIQPEVILLDYQLPGKNGLEILQELTQDMPCPVIMVTGKGDEYAAVTSMRAGAADYLRKETMEPEELARAVFRALAASGYEAARKAAEARNEQATAPRNAIFSSMKTPSILLDRHGGVIRINEQGVAAFGWTPGESAGRHFHDLAHRLQPDEVREDPFDCPVRDMLQPEGPREIEHQFICRSDGSFAKGTLRMKRIEAGEICLGFVVTFEPDAVATKDSELARAQSRELRDVLNVISHVVRTPMTPIMMEMAQLQRLSKTDEKIARAVTVVDRNFRRMKRVFDHALESVAIRRGDLRLRKVPTDLRDVVTDAAAQIEEAAKDQAVTLTMKLTKAPIYGDPQALSLAVSRFMTAALLRTPPNRTISIEITVEDSVARLVIEDIGPKIDQTQISVLLDPFGFFVDERTSGEHVEAALRFYSAKMHAEANGAKITINSESTTQVVMTLPLYKGNQENGKTASPAGHEPAHVKH